MQVETHAWQVNIIGFRGNAGNATGVLSPQLATQ